MKKLIIILLCVFSVCCTGLVVQLTQELYEFLHELEERLTRTIKSVGKISHAFWRSFNTDIKTDPAEGFIDGDLIESFLDLGRDVQQETVQGLQVPHSDVRSGPNGVVLSNGSLLITTYDPLIS